MMRQFGEDTRASLWTTAIIVFVVAIVLAGLAFAFLGFGGSGAQVSYEQQSNHVVVTADSLGNAQLLDVQYIGGSAGLMVKDNQSVRVRTLPRGGDIRVLAVYPDGSTTVVSTYTPK